MNNQPLPRVKRVKEGLFVLDYERGTASFNLKKGTINKCRSIGYTNSSH